jgi:hypothetical protein
MSLLEAFRIAGLLTLLTLEVTAQTRGAPNRPTEVGPRLPYRDPQLDRLTTAGTVPNAILEYYHALGWLKTYASRLQRHLGDRLPETRLALEQIQTDASFLQEKWLGWSRQNPGRRLYASSPKLDGYLRAIQAEYKQLNKLRQAGDGEVRSIVSAIASDLKAKAEHCRHSKDGLGKDIKVTVRTKRGVQEVPGYEVWCAPMALVQFKDEHIRFPKFSSPTTLASLAPGFYAMWLERDRAQTQPMAQTVGGHGETALEIDVPIPANAAATP